MISQYAVARAWHHKVQLDAEEELNVVADGRALSGIQRHHGQPIASAVNAAGGADARPIGSLAAQ